MLSPKQSQPEVPQPCYHRSGKKCGQPLPVCKLLRTENLSTLITTSSTGTDALTSTTDVPEYCQVSNKETFSDWKS
ncbi:hypothetical protein EB796_007865 [Bugula neritina]|uniref:Uncharacterized protein n=1 Tax=Bugula neritina TaxID=10212 RepID=A0A7J7K879_BUGNE|nr:hypothetical protein EB796_007865 [Bugula neritina]